MIISITSEDSDIDAINILQNNVHIISNQYIDYPSYEASTESNIYDGSDESDVTEAKDYTYDDDDLLDIIYCIACNIL